jgi:UDP-N-acetylglucosamine--N-acetylmuramyl-(pentapeptide) pyrophosphoryl-undecaprenol N-acetylglucosamine transferase
VRVWFAGGGTGGHLFPALGIARALTQARPDVRCFFIGARRGIEREVLPRSEFPHLLLDIHPLYRSRPWRNWKTLRGAATAGGALARLGGEQRPAAVVATGGYAAVAALVHAVVHKIPIILQEQNSSPGLTTRVFSRFARQIHLGYPEAARRLHPRKDALVRNSGNPIVPPEEMRSLQSRGVARQRWGFTADDRARVLLVFGGSQGARGINAVVAQWARMSQPPSIQLLWITGPAEYPKYAELSTERIRVVPFVTPMSEAYAAADLALARAGAMSTAELCAWGIPAVLVPLPTAAADHQTTNARALEQAGAAVVILQRELTVERLSSTVTKLASSPDKLARMSAAALHRARPRAAEEIARDVIELLSPAT